jgi:hypothetical protein
MEKMWIIEFLFPKAVGAVEATFASSPELLIVPLVVILMVLLKINDQNEEDN